MPAIAAVTMATRLNTADTAATINGNRTSMSRPTSNSKATILNIRGSSVLAALHATSLKSAYSCNHIAMKRVTFLKSSSANYNSSVRRPSQAKCSEASKRLQLSDSPRHQKLIAGRMPALPPVRGRPLKTHNQVSWQSICFRPANRAPNRHRCRRNRLLLCPSH